MSRKVARVNILGQLFSRCSQHKIKLRETPDGQGAMCPIGGDTCITNMRAKRLKFKFGIKTLRYFK